jgi:hypothetical protein
MEAEFFGLQQRGQSMFKKGLVTLVCLTVMSALWAWATTTYSISTKINSLGTVKVGTRVVNGVTFDRFTTVIGGTIKVRNVTLNKDINAQDRSIKYSQLLSSDNAEVVVTPKLGYKIASLSQTGTGITPVTVAANQTAAVTIPVSSPNPLATQYIVATFAPEATTATVTKNWQLQVMNNSLGGTIKVVRAAAIDNYSVVGKALVKSYIDTTPVNVTVTPDAGYSVAYVILDGAKVFANPFATEVNVVPSGSSRLKTIVVGYKKNAIRVTTHVAAEITTDAVTGGIKYADNGILPTNPAADPNGNVRLVVTPTGTNNVVKSITVANTDTADTTLTATWKYYDRFGAELTTLANHVGPVKLVISNITEPITVKASYFLDAKNAAGYTNCTQTCHADTKLVPESVRTAATDWLGSTHANNPYHTVDCVGCHQTMPGPTVTATTCKGCHAGTYAPVLSAKHDAGASCLKCHNQHTLETAGATCDSCHTKTIAGAHAAKSCQDCHGTNMHNPVAAPACATCHSTGAQYVAWAAGPHGTGTGHTTGTCQRCHTTEGAINGDATGWTGGYADVLSKNTYVAVTASNGVGCAACHNAHNGSLRSAKTLVAGVLTDWNPNNNGSTNDQYDVCTKCHTLTDNAGAVVGNYHNGGSVNIGRTISDSHFDNAATGTTAAGTTIEGYNLRTNGANPCADCHNLHSADLTVQEQWAKSGHAGQIAAVKADTAAACAASLTWFNNLFPANQATTCNDSKTVIVPPATTASTRTVIDFFGRSADGVAYYTSKGATDASGVAWTHYNWDDSTGTSTDRKACQRCHTATGVSNFLTDPVNYNPANNDFSHLAGWATAKASAQQELLYCWGCHSDSQTGVLRNPGALTLDYSTADNDTIVYPNVDKSNVCVACHSGNGGSGKSIANSTADLSNTAAIQPHYLTAAGTLLTANGGGTGYEFAGVTYTKNGTHQKIGSNDFYGTGTEGPCVSCHMSGAEKHTFEVSAASAVCANCHAGLTDLAIEEAKTAYNASLVELDKALQAKGIFFIPSYPYFVYDNGFGGSTPNDGIIQTGEKDRNNGIKNWTTQVAGGTAKDTMGAAFNYNLLVHEPGAFAHNKAYAYELIQSSIDYLADGKVDGLGVNAKVATAAASKEFAESTQHPAATVAAASSTSCADCHKSAPHYTTDAANQAAFVAQDLTCVSCHANGDVAANQQILVQYAESGHGDVKGAAWISEEMYGASCVRCHSTSGFIAGQAPATPFTGTAAAPEAQQVLACAGCHTNLETGEVRVKGQITATYKSKTLVDPAAGTWSAAALATFPSVGAGNDVCISCHSGRESGESILALTDMTNVGFKNPHYLGAAGMMYAKLAFVDFTDRNTVIGSTTYGKSVTSNEDGGGLTSTHRKLGTPVMVNDSHVGGRTMISGGPCITCHMADDNGQANHTWEINENAFSKVCVNCHSSELGTPLTTANFKEHFIEAQAEGYEQTIELALDLLQTKYGIVYDGGTHPYFFNKDVTAHSSTTGIKNWTTAGGFLTTPLSTVEAQKLMGACLNVKLMKADPAAYVHARSYARRVLYDTIDWLDDGTINLSVGQTAIDWSVAKGNTYFTKGLTAYTAGQSVAGVAVAEGTSEGMLYILGWDRNSGAWVAPERP